MCYQAVFLIGCICTIPAFLFSFAICGWCVDESHRKSLHNSASREISKASGPIWARIDSWTQVPFVDITVIDALENPNGCPASHPEELIFEIWHGTRGVCDLLEVEDTDYRVYINDEGCEGAHGYEKNGRNYATSPEYDTLHVVWGLNPSI